MDTSNTNQAKPRKPLPAAYALHRQMLAVQRTVTAASVAESERAARWAHAWYMLVQRKLEEFQPAPRYPH